MVLNSQKLGRWACAGVALALAGLVAGTASARPGAPHEERAWSPAPGMMGVSWKNTASETAWCSTCRAKAIPAWPTTIRARSA